jgi:hypothetical protein
MNGFFEDLEDGLEPREADYALWTDHGEREDGLRQLVVSEVTFWAIERPDLGTLMEWLSDESGCEATDGCRVEPAGTCPHGYHSWLLVLGLI